MSQSADRLRERERGGRRPWQSGMDAYHVLLTAGSLQKCILKRTFGSKCEEGRKGREKEDIVAEELYYRANCGMVQSRWNDPVFGARYLALDPNLSLLPCHSRY